MKIHARFSLLTVALLALQAASAFAQAPSFESLKPLEGRLLVGEHDTLQISFTPEGWLAIAFGEPRGQTSGRYVVRPTKRGQLLLEESAQPDHVARMKAWLDDDGTLWVSSMPREYHAWRRAFSFRPVSLNSRGDGLLVSEVVDFVNLFGVPTKKRAPIETNYLVANDARLDQAATAYRQHIDDEARELEEKRERSAQRLAAFSTFMQGIATGLEDAAYESSFAADSQDQLMYNVSGDPVYLLRMNERAAAREEYEYRRELEQPADEPDETPQYEEPAAVTSGRAFAWCTRTTEGEFMCSGPAQELPEPVAPLGRALEQVGCTDGSGDTPEFGSGTRFDCGREFRAGDRAVPLVNPYGRPE